MSGYFIGDSVFPLSNHLLKLYPEHRRLFPIQVNFNKRISATKLVIENAFKRLKARFRKLYSFEGNKKKHSKINYMLFYFT